MSKLDGKSQYEIEKEIQEMQDILDKHWKRKTPNYTYDPYNKEEMVSYYEKTYAGKKALKRIKKEEEYRFFNTVDRFTLWNIIESANENYGMIVAFFQKKDVESYILFDFIFDLTKDAFYYKYDDMMQKIEKEYPNDADTQENVRRGILCIEGIVRIHIERCIENKFLSWCFDKSPFWRSYRYEKKEEEIRAARSRALTEDPIYINKGEEEYI